MSEFSVGEIAIFVGLELMSEYNGTECTIIGGLRRGLFVGHRSGAVIGGSAYIVRAIDGLEFSARPENLRKKRPPAELSTWQQVLKDTGWTPRGVTA